jgi:protein-S-isoprenylcysteine O-methyltransferase Ste14
MSTDAPPRSASSLAISFVGMVGLILGLLLARSPGVEPAVAPLLILLAAAGPMLLWAVLAERAHHSPEAGLDWSRPRPWREVRRTAGVKLLGLWATWAVIAAAYWTFRVLHTDNLAWAFGLVRQPAMLALVPVSAAYVLLVDRVMREPRDDLWHAGAALLGLPGVERAKLADHARAWLVKGFFLGFMFGILPGGTAGVVGQPAAGLLDDPVRLAAAAIGFVFFFDLIFGTVGYLCAFRVVGTHIRTANPYLTGWVAALICYPPFVLMGPGALLNYTAGTRAWSHWIGGRPEVVVAYAVVLLLLVGLYAWSTVIFGLRFSNLTHRGIITNGPYRWFKHPAYLSKNAFWWLAHLPFLTVTGPAEGARNAVILLLVNAVYWWRARTEERHLDGDPDYRAYAGWIERRGLLPRLWRALRIRGARPPGLPAAARASVDGPEA